MTEEKGDEEKVEWRRKKKKRATKCNIFTRPCAKGKNGGKPCKGEKR